MTAVLPRGLPAASTTYHLRSMLALFAMKVDMVFFLQFIIMYALHFRVPLLKSGQRKRTERAMIFIA